MIGKQAASVQLAELDLISEDDFQHSVLLDGEKWAFNAGRPRGGACRRA